MKMPKWMKILFWSVGVFTAIALASAWWLTDQVHKGYCSSRECLRYWDLSNWAAISSGWVIIALAILYPLYLIVFRRAEWLERWRSRPKMPVWFWVLYCAWFVAYMAINQYSRQHEELRSLGSVMHDLWMLLFMIPMCIHPFAREKHEYQKKRQWKYLLVAGIFVLGMYSLYSTWDSIGTSDLRYCLGQTYFQRVPVQSTGCEIIKAIPTPRYFTGRRCPTTDLFAGCESGYPWGFNSYNQRKAAGIVTDYVPLPWNTGPRPKYTAGGECVAADPTTGAAASCK